MNKEEIVTMLDKLFNETKIKMIDMIENDNIKNDIFDNAYAEEAYVIGYKLLPHLVKLTFDEYKSMSIELSKKLMKLQTDVIGVLEKKTDNELDELDEIKKYANAIVNNLDKPKPNWN